MMDVLNFFILVYFSIILMVLVKAYLEYLKVKNDKSKVHRIEIEIPLPHKVVYGLITVIRNLLKK